MAKNILVIDDNEEITDLVQAILGPPSYTCLAVNSGKEGLDILRKQEFDLVLLDLAMPDMSGLDVLSALGEEKGSHNIVIFTASPEYTEEELEKLKEWHGKIERVQKPFTDDELLAVVEKHLK